jgi:hypothetical protein
MGIMFSVLVESVIIQNVMAPFRKDSSFLPRGQDIINIYDSHCADYGARSFCLLAISPNTQYPMKERHSGHIESRKA